LSLALNRHTPPLSLLLLITLCAPISSIKSEISSVSKFHREISSNQDASLLTLLTHSSSMTSQKRAKPEDDPAESLLRVMLILVHGTNSVHHIVLALPASVVQWLDKCIHTYSPFGGGSEDPDDLLPNIIERLAPTDELAARISKEWKDGVEEGKDMVDFWEQATEDWLVKRALPGSCYDIADPKPMMWKREDLAPLERIWLVPTNSE